MNYSEIFVLKDPPPEITHYKIMVWYTIIIIKMQYM